MKYDLAAMRIIHYPDPRLRRRAEPVTQFGDELDALARRMLALMREHKGVGLAGPQVGVGQRIFVACVSENPDDARVFVNPELHDLEGAAEAEEGCLSIPGVLAQVRRATHARITALDALGRPFELHGADLMCRVWQHETDHLNGVLIVDRMNAGDRIASRATLRALEQSHRERAGGD
ncbi:MAG: peptide deformylase [Phycisphaerae bacterium]